MLHLLWFRLRCQLFTLNLLRRWLWRRLLRQRLLLRW
jgi:hypothetical protein